MRRKRKLWNGKWCNTVKGRRELLVQYTLLLNDLDTLRERVRFMQAIAQKAVVALQRQADQEREP